MKFNIGQPVEDEFEKTGVIISYEDNSRFDKDGRYIESKKYKIKFDEGTISFRMEPKLKASNTADLTEAEQASFNELMTYLEIDAALAFRDKEWFDVLTTGLENS